jgi:3-hydroxyisobutyrate dehydrogenase
MPTMSAATLGNDKLGWIGAGRMGFAMAARIAKAGGDIAVYNRTRTKAEPLTEYGASIVDKPVDLADRDVVFVMVAGSEDLLSVTLGREGVLSQPDRAPKILVDCSTVSQEASAELRAAAAKRGTQLLAAPVSGNAKVVKAGKLSVIVSGPRDAYDSVLPYLECLGRGASYVGEGDVSRIVKICHNVFLGAVIQSLVEVTILAEKAGVPRHAFLDVINKSVMGSVFTAYKSPALVNLDMTPTFTPYLLRKDLELGLAAARALDVPMPLCAATKEIVQSLIGSGHVDDDFAALILLQAQHSGLDIKPENVKVDDGLH